MSVVLFAEVRVHLFHFINLFHDPSGLAIRTCSNLMLLILYLLLRVPDFTQGGFTGSEAGCHTESRDIVNPLNITWGIWEWRQQLFSRGGAGNQREVKPWTLVPELPHSIRTPSKSSRCYLCFPFCLANVFPRSQPSVERGLVNLFQEHPLCPV